MSDRGLVIIGNGIAGVSTARHYRMRSSAPITIISSESKHFFSRTALMYIYMGHMKYEHTKPYEDHFWEKNKIDLLFDHVTSIDTQAQRLDLKSGAHLEYDQLVIATGSKTATYHWTGLELEGVQGLYSLQDLEKMQRTTQSIKRAVIVGGGLIGVEMAEMLHSRGISVDYLIREKAFWGNVLPLEEAHMVGRQLERAGISMHLQTELQRINGDEKGSVRSVLTHSSQEIECEFVGITTGVKPNIELLKESSIKCNKGVLVDQNLRTNIHNIYAVGDCAELKEPADGRRSIEAVWYVGKMMGEVAAANLAGVTTEYRPGPWFNSAKFFDLEYQTYGKVNVEPTEKEASLLWQDPDKDQLMRINFDRENGAVIGINVLGIRLDHKVCDHWIREETSIVKVIADLKEADFNPEFHRIPFSKMQKEFTQMLEGAYEYS